MCLALGWPTGSALEAHGLAGHETVTWSAAASGAARPGQPTLRLRVLDAATDEPTAARLELLIDRRPWIPPVLGEGGLRFTAVHVDPAFRFTATYALGTGPVEVPLPPGARTGRVLVAKGYEYLPASADFEVSAGITEITVRLERWSDSRAEGWVSADEHIHFDRTDPSHDADWLALLAGDDLDIGHFLLARGTNVEGLWGTQYAFGADGEAADGRRLVRPGEEYRDGAQGHVNLLGIRGAIQPISAGGLRGAAVWSYPPLRDVLTAAHRQGALAGIAHGGAYGTRSTAVLDTVLGTADFFEIANTHLYRPELWYRLLDCGWLLPPAAGTDLPNFPYRDWWQPLFGEVRMYARTGGAVDFASWKAAVERGEVWIGSGPTIRLSVDGVGPGGTVRLPAGGGAVTVRADLASPRRLVALEVVSGGTVIERADRERVADGIHRLRIELPLHLDRSAWIAARGEGPPKRALSRRGHLEVPAMAHTAAVAVLVGGQPVRSPSDAESLALQLEADRDHYRRHGRFRRRQDAAHFLAGFDRALAVLQRRGATTPASGPASAAAALLVITVLALLAGLAGGWRAGIRSRRRRRDG